MHSKVITIILLFTINTSLSKTDTVRTDSSFYYMTDDCLTDRVFQKLKELVKLAANILFLNELKLSLFFITGASDILRKKKQNFMGFSGANSRKNRLISRDFRREKKSKFAKKIGRFRGIFAGEKSKFAEKSADFAGF